MQKIAAVSGVKNSGKTTFLTRLIPALRDLGIRTAVIKHDGHTFLPDREGTDTFRLLEAGACGAAVFDGEKFQAVKYAAVTERDLLALYPEADLILLEGFKHSPYPKIEILRRAVSTAPVCDPSTLLALVTDTDLRPSGVPVFSPEDVPGVARLLKDWLNDNHIQEAADMGIQDFHGKTAFITGGASGLGLGIARALAKRGANIVIADFRQEALDAALPLFREQGWPCHPVLLDVMDREAFQRAADEAEAAFGKIHILVNNAGIGLMEGPIWEASYEDMDFAIDINFKSVLNGIKTVLPRILKHGEEGWVVSTSSKNGIIPLPGMVLYNSTKRAVMAVMETLALDLQGTNVGASVFCPGPFRTNLNVTTDKIREMHLGAPFAKRFSPNKGAVKKEDLKGLDMAGKERDPAEAGERVVRGIMRGDLFIFTHAEWKKGWQEHADAITRAIPDEVPDPDFIKVFPRNVAAPIYNRQTQVPAWKPEE